MMSEHMLDSEILELIGKGLAFENVTKAKTRSAGETLLKLAPRIAEMEALLIKRREEDAKDFVR
jgi:hypothetical protein